MNKIIKLSKGLTLVLNEMASTRSVAIGVYVGCGADYESARTSGISHFIEHMLFKGTEKRTAFDIAREAESKGVQMNAFTSRQMTSFYTVSTDEHAGECMELLSDIFFNSVFDPAEAEREKGVVIEEIHRSLDDPDDVCFDALSAAVYGDTPKGRPILGSVQNVRSFTPDMMREYMKTHYGARNTVISIAGRISEAEAEDLAEKYFAEKFSSLGECARLEKIMPRYGSVSTQKDMEQAVMAFAFPGYGYSSPNAIPLKIAANILGGGMSSRLFQSVREQKGLAYDVYSISGTAKEDGIFEIYVGTNPSSVEEAVKTIAGEIESLRSKGITEDELGKAKEQMKTSQVLASETAQYMMRAAGRAYILSGNGYDLDESLAEISAVTKEDVERVVSECLDPDKASSSFVAKDASVDIGELIRGSREGV